jgi:hypothetical protein
MNKIILKYISNSFHNKIKRFFGEKKIIEKPEIIADYIIYINQNIDYKSAEKIMDAFFKIKDAKINICQDGELAEVIMDISKYKVILVNKKNYV